MPRCPLVLAVLLATTSARALGPGRIQLRWHAGAGADACISEDELRRGVIARLGRDPFSPDGQYIVDAGIEREAGVYRARIRMLDDRGREIGARDLDSTSLDCRGISQAVALAVALATAEVPVPPEPAPPSAEPSPFEPGPPPAPRAPASPWGNVTIRGLAAVGVAPPYALGFGAGAHGRLSDHLSAHLALMALFPTAQEEGSDRATLLAIAGSLSIDTGSPRTLALCLGAQAGDYAVTLADGETHKHRLWLAGTIGPRFELRPTRGLVVEAGGELLLPVLDHRVVRADGSRTGVPPQGGFLLYLGVGTTFP